MIDPNLDLELIEDGDDLKAVPQVSGISIIVGDLEFPGNTVEGKLITLFRKIGELYQEKKVATLDSIRLGTLVEDVSAFYSVIKYPTRIVHLLGFSNDSSLQSARLEGRLLDYDLFSQGNLELAVVQRFRTMNEKIIPYDPLQVHKLLAREVPLLRF